jgi:hypothetical protein
LAVLHGDTTAVVHIHLETFQAANRNARLEGCLTVGLAAPARFISSEQIKTAE